MRSGVIQDSTLSCAMHLVCGAGTYTHSYFDKGNRTDSHEAPPYTLSWSELLQAHSETCEWVAPGEKQWT